MEKNDDSMWGSGRAVGVGKNEQAKAQYVGV